MKIIGEINIISCVNGWKFYLDEKWLGDLLKVCAKRLKSMVR